MKILFISPCTGRSRCLLFGRRSLFVSLLTVFLLMPAVALYVGYRLGHTELQVGAQEDSGLQEQLAEQLRSITEARREAEENLNALALRLGRMQAHVTRLDALGQRLTDLSGLEDGEFDFAAPPAMGGPEILSAQQSMQVPDFLALMDNLSAQLQSRGEQLGLLETLLLNHNIQAEVVPAGRPIDGGWISSPFGTRTDPFTGRLAQHNGIDFAGKEGMEIYTVAAGVVTRAGAYRGYGNLVEINHGKGYVTRYGHNKSVTVKAGETVKKGQTVAIMGSTGRSTGPHVHFEVLRNGRAVDPARYVNARR